MDTIEKNVNDWFQMSTFGHQEELGFKRDSFMESEMILFGQICAEKQKAIDDEELGKALLYAVHKTTERTKREMIERSCEWLCKTCNIGVCGEDQKCHRYKGFRKAMEK